MIRQRTLPNGIRVIAESVPSVRTCGVGIWLEAGSRQERGDERGLTHFLEHMLFKGTKLRDVQKLADAMNWLGGNVNAFTSQEHLCLHARTIDSKAPQALELLCEMLTASTFPPDEVKRERQVVLEECKMIEDAPDEFSVDLFMKNLWPGHPLGEPVIGTKETIRRFNREQLDAFWRERLRPERIVVAIAGAYDAAACNKAIRRWLAPLKPAKRKLPADRRPGTDATRRRTSLSRPIEQSHFCLGCSAPHRRSPERFAFSLMNMVIGGGMSSRLFQEIREKRGLAYSIGSFTQYFSDSGIFAVSGGTSPKTLDEVLAISRAEIEKICDEAVPEAELDLARAQMLDSIVMGLENTETRMMRLADGVLTHGKPTPVDDIINAVLRVTPAEVRASARRHLGVKPMALGVIGPRAARRAN